MKNYLASLVKDLNGLVDDFDEDGWGRDESEVEEFLIWQRQEVEFFNRYGKATKVNLEILPKTLNAKRIEGIKSDLLYTFTMRFYKKREADGLYVLDETIDMSSTEYDFLCKNFVFVRGRIVWVNFGFGIGNEFEGIKPALILGDAGPGELFILPMINEEGSDENPNYAVVEIDCSEPPVSGIAVINELRLISTNRIVTSRDSAAIDNETLLYVIARIAKFYANFYK